MGNNLVGDLAVTDPPCNVDCTGRTEQALKIKNDSKSDADFYAFLLASYGYMAEVMKDGAGIYVFHADTEGANFPRGRVDLRWASIALDEDEKLSRITIYMIDGWWESLSVSSLA